MGGSQGRGIAGRTPRSGPGRRPRNCIWLPLDPRPGRSRASGIMRGMTAPKPRRRTIRFAIVAVVCLLLGAVTTVGIAMWILLFSPTASRTEEITPANWPAPVPDSWQSPIYLRLHWSVWQSKLFAADYRFVEERRELDDIGGVVVTRSGWPIRALESRRYSFGYREMEEWPGDVHGLSLACFPDPLIPLWPGFALDTALYAAAWYLLIFTPLPLIRAGRRRFRVSRGMCGSCGYDLNASTNRPCPECGA